MTRKTLCTAAVALGLLALAILGSGCSGNLPHVSYQGRLTDASGNPLNGSVDITIRLYHTDTGGTPYYTDTNSGVTVTDGLFDVVIDPSAVGDLSPADINQASWIEVEIDNGTYSETLSPRQQVLGAPYAMTLMAGTTISSTMDSNMLCGTAWLGRSRPSRVSPTRTDKKDDITVSVSVASKIRESAIMTQRSTRENMHIGMV